MTHPSDIAGLSERLRAALGGIAREECLGDNIAILLASYFEPHIEDETLDECGNWKQGAIDACDKVLDAIHAHYATALDSLTARVKELEEHNRRLGQGGAERYWEDRYRDEAAALARAEQQRDEAQRDAARYQFLRGRDLDTIHNGGVFAGMTPQNIILNEGDLDREVDAAIGNAESGNLVSGSPRPDPQ